MVFIIIIPSKIILKPGRKISNNEKCNKYNYFDNNVT